MTKVQTLITRIPFGGFYDSIWSGEIDHTESQWCEYEAESRQEEEGIPADLRLSESELADLLFRHTRYQVAYEKVAEWYVAAVSYCVKDVCDIDLRLTFESMSSPREYNFETDRLFAHIPVSVVRKLWAISKRENHARLKVRIAESYTSCDGFWSHYGNHLQHDDWRKPVTDYDHNQLCTLIEAVTDWQANFEDWESLYYATFGDEGGYQAWESAVDWQAFDSDVAEMRADKLADLQEENPDYVPPYRCPETPDLFAAMGVRA